MSCFSRTEHHVTGRGLHDNRSWWNILSISWLYFVRGICSTRLLNTRLELSKSFKYVPIYTSSAIPHRSEVPPASESAAMKYLLYFILGNLCRVIKPSYFDSGSLDCLPHWKIVRPCYSPVVTSSFFSPFLFFFPLLRCLLHFPLRIKIVRVLFSLSQVKSCQW